jgi:hypothetical protein
MRQLLYISLKFVSFALPIMKTALLPYQPCPGKSLLRNRIAHRLPLATGAGLPNRPSRKCFPQRAQQILVRHQLGSRSDGPSQQPAYRFSRLTVAQRYVRVAAMAVCCCQQGTANVVRSLHNFDCFISGSDAVRNLLEVRYKLRTVSLTYKGKHAKQVMRPKLHGHNGLSRQSIALKKS